MILPREACSWFVLGCFLGAQELVLPDNHHLMEHPSQLANTGSSDWWRSTGGRFQILYQASHFVGKAAISGAVGITRLRFRGEDGEPNLGGQVYSGVTVQIGSTTLTSLTAAWPYNLAPGIPHSTTMGSLVTTNVAVLPSVGSTPNNWCIDIDLLALGALWLHDPTGPQPNLLIDVTMPTPPVGAPPLALVPIQDTTATGAGIRGNGVTSSAPFGMSGLVSANPPVVGIEFQGPVGNPLPTPASNTTYGAACGGQPSTFYERFQNGQPFDLPGLTIFPDNSAAPSFYHVDAVPLFVDPTKLNPLPNSVADDALVTYPLGFTFLYPGGATNTIKASTNGFLWLDASMTATGAVPRLGDLLGSSSASGARLMPFWTDLVPGRNTATHPLCGLHVMTDFSGGPGFAVCYITWEGVGSPKTVSGPGVGGHADYTFQCVLRETTNTIEFRYQSMPAFVAHSSSDPLALHAVVGFTRGRIGGTPSVDPQSRDLSIERPFTTSIEGANGNVGLTAVATPDAGGLVYGGRCFGGQSITYDVTNIPAGTLLAMVILDLGSLRPGFQFPGVTAPGCMISTSLSPVVFPLQSWFAPGSSVTGTVPLTVPHGWEGIAIYAQAIGLDVFGGPDLVPWASNLIQHIVGFD